MVWNCFDSLEIIVFFSCFQSKHQGAGICKKKCSFILLDFFLLFSAQVQTDYYNNKFKAARILNLTSNHNTVTFSIIIIILRHFNPTTFGTTVCMTIFFFFYWSDRVNIAYYKLIYFILVFNLILFSLA